jgi:hypothetical protein
VIDFLYRTCEVDDVTEIVVGPHLVGSAIQQGATTPVIALDGKPLLAFSFEIHFT